MDLRTERTKRSIINAFIELRTKKPLEKITIKELSELAYINKATFYSHYHDIYDLSEQLENETIASVIKNIPHPENLILNPKQGTQELTASISSLNSLVNILFSDSRASLLSKKIENALKKDIYQRYPEYKNNLEWDILLSVLIQGCFHAFNSYSTNANINDVIKIIGDINECLIQNYMGKITPSHSDV